MSHNYLPKWELAISFVLHTTFILYSIWNVFSFRKEIHHLSEPETFTRGWFGFYKEVSDSEWENFKSYAVISWPWMVSHVIISLLLRINRLEKILPWTFTVIGFAFLALENGIILTTFLTLKLIPYFYIPKRFGGKGVLLLALLSLLIANLSRSDQVYFWIMDNTSITHSKLVQMVVVDGWTTLKCISFALDKQDSDEAKVDEGHFRLAHFLGYAFYFPTLHLGPPIIYSRFKTCYTEMEFEGKSLIKVFLRDILTVSIWTVALELSHHFLYLTNLQYLLETLKKFPLMGLFGYGYLMGQQFQMKYVVLYGFSCAFAKLDGIDTPPRPICVARVHKYSDMWKHFDRGLHEFLVKYIYTRFQSRSSGNIRKIFAMFTTFAFIYVWHGYFLAILAWSFLNSIGILLEQLTKAFQRSNSYRNWIVLRFSSNNVHRIEAVLGTHLLILAVISNFFFLANYEVGVLFLKRTYATSISSYIALATALQCIFFTSEYCKRRLSPRVIEN